MNNRVTALCDCVCKCTEVLNADTCTDRIYSLYNDVVWMFSYACWSRAVLQLRVGSFLCTAVVRQVCNTAVGLHFCVILSSFFFFFCWLGLTENVTDLQKFSYQQTKAIFYHSTQRFDRQTLGSLFTTLCWYCFWKTPSSWAEETRGRRSGGGHKRSASWGSAEHLREVSTSVHQYSSSLIRCSVPHSYSRPSLGTLPLIAWKINSPWG